METLVALRGDWIDRRREGCTTDKVVENIKTKLGSGDELDGFGELTYPPLA